MRKSRIKSFNISKYLPVVIILIAFTIIIGSTFAYFTDNKQNTSDLVFSKVELSAETNVGISGTLRDAIAGTKLIDSEISFSKSIDSEPIYVRAKISFTSTSNVEEMSQYLIALRNAKDYGIVENNQNNAFWSEKEGNYIYLLNEDKTSLKIIDDVFTYVLTESLIVPYDLEQLPNFAQYMESINFNIAFEAIQATNINGSMQELKEIFNQVFPLTYEEMGEKIELTYFESGSDVRNVLSVQKGLSLDKVDFNIAENQILIGWYTDSEFNNKLDNDYVLNEDITLYPQIKTVTDLNSFVFNDSILVSYVGTESEVVIPKSYSLGDIVVSTQVFTQYREAYDYVMETRPIVYPIVAVDANNISYTINNVREFLDLAMYIGRTYPAPVTIDVKLQTYIPGNDYLVESIGGFYGSGSILESVYIPEGVKVINGSAFSNCSLIKEINLPESLEIINSSAFSGCAIENIFIPKNVKEIGVNPFSSTQLKNIIVDENNKIFTDYNSNCIIEIETNNLISGSASSVIPNGVIEIKSNAFANNELLSSINIPDSVTLIDSYAFHKCSNLYNIDINPNASLNTISSMAFGYCSSLKSYHFTDNLIVLSDYAFQYSGLEKVIMSNSIEEIGYCCFNQCENLTEVIFSNNLRKLEDSVFGFTPYYSDSNNILGNILIGYNNAG